MLDQDGPRKLLSDVLKRSKPQDPDGMNEHPTDELRAATGWGPTARVAPVATAWAELAGVMRQTGAGQVRELAPDVVTRLAPRLWVVLPGGAG